MVVSGRPEDVMTPDHLVRLLQMTGAALAIPAAAAGTFAAYQSYFSTDVTCQKLRNDIMGIMERNVDPNTKRSLLKKDVTEFDKLCGEVDPDARAIFQAAMSEHPAQATHAAATSPPVPIGASSPRAQTAALGVFGAPGSKDRYGWVALARRQSGSWEPHFSGYAISDTSCRLPARFYPPRRCCRSGPSRRPAPTIRVSCRAACRAAPACASSRLAAAAADCGPKSRPPRARERKAIHVIAGLRRKAGCRTCRAKAV
jgi:hypothetical protein